MLPLTLVEVKVQVIRVPERNSGKCRKSLRQAGFREVQGKRGFEITALSMLSLVLEPKQ